jgi:hypothetical protein
MTNAGNPSPEQSSPTAASRRWVFSILLALVGMIAFLGWIGLQATGILVALIDPPMPPVPINTEFVGTEQLQGRDYWHYRIPEQDVCEAIALYVQEGSCQPDDISFCVTTTDASPIHISCYGDVPFASFTMRWEANLHKNNGDVSWSLEVSRFIAWLGGAIPPPTPVERLPN